MHMSGHEDVVQAEEKIKRSICSVLSYNFGYRFSDPI